MPDAFAVKLNGDTLVTYDWAACPDIKLSDFEGTNIVSTNQTKFHKSKP